MRILITGWFSFDDMGATAGDLICRDMVSQWLKDTNIPADIADSEKFPVNGGVNWLLADPFVYTDLLFVCGPFGNGWPVTELMNRYAHCRLTGINLSLMDPLDVWNPFALLFERDSFQKCNPDITLYAAPPSVPVVGVILSHKQKEYGSRSLHETANTAIEQLLNKTSVAKVPIDTGLLNNGGGLKTAGAIESLIAKMDVVITTRLHGTALAIKNGVPVVPIDPIAGGAKISLQVQALNWPFVFNADSLDEDKLMEAFNYCLTTHARMKAKECAIIATQRIASLKQDFLSKICQMSDGCLSDV